MDRTGRIVIQCQYDDTKHFSEGLAAVKTNKKWGYINKSGLFMIDPNFDAVGVFKNGLASARVGSKWGIIDKKGNFVVEPLFKSAYSQGSSACVMNHNGKLGYRSGFEVAVYNKTEKALVWLPTVGPTIFIEGLTTIFIEDKWSFGRKGKWGYMDESGKMVIEPQFDYADRFYDGLARIGIRVDK